MPFNVNLGPDRPRDPSFRPDCPACDKMRLHTANERAAYHRLAGHGYSEGQGWSTPELDPKRKEQAS